MTSGAILDVARDGMIVFLKAGGPLIVTSSAEAYLNEYEGNRYQ